MHRLYYIHGVVDGLRTVLEPCDAEFSDHEAHRMLLPELEWHVAGEWQYREAQRVPVDESFALRVWQLRDDQRARADRRLVEAHDDDATECLELVARRDRVAATCDVVRSLR